MTVTVFSLHSLVTNIICKRT